MNELYSWEYDIITGAPPRGLIKPRPVVLLTVNVYPIPHREHHNHPPVKEEPLTYKLIKIHITHTKSRG